MRCLTTKKEYPDHTASMMQDANENLIPKRGLLDVLDVHACAGSEIGETGKKIKSSGSKDGIPYEPSLISMPRTSSSDVSVKFGQNSISYLFYSTNMHNLKAKNEIQLNLSTAESVKDMAIESKYSTLFPSCKWVRSNLVRSKNQNWRRVSRELSILSDIIPEQSNDSLLVTNSSLISSKNTADKEKCKSMDLEKYCDEKSFNCIAENVNDSTYLKSYINKSRNNHVSLENAGFGNNEDSSITSLLRNLEVNETSNRSKLTNMEDSLREKYILCLFDCNKFPLTDKEGNVLSTANDLPLVVFRNGKPKYDCFKRLVLDKDGESSRSINFKPYRKHQKLSLPISRIPLFDFRGFPLTDCDGSSLINASGTSLITIDSESRILSDINNNPVFDKSGIPITKRDDYWLTPMGLAYRVFDDKKYPLTDKHGETLYDIKSVSLLHCDVHGRPIVSYCMGPVYDVKGRLPSDPNFNPTVQEETGHTDVIMFLETKPTKVFNRQGFPLTDRHGVVLKNADGKFLVSINNYVRSKTLLKRGHYPILQCSPKNQTLHLQSPINDHLVEDGTANGSGRLSCEYPILDYNEEYVYDSKGMQLFSEYFSINNSNLNIFCNRNLKSSDMSSNLLSLHENFQNTPEESSEELAIEFETEFDIFGRPLYDSFNRPLFDKFGRPKFDLFMRPIYDSAGRFMLVSKINQSSDDSREDRKPNHNAIKSLKPLFSENSDLNGGPIFDKFGKPLYDALGRPLRDAFGRQLYDEFGRPLCDENGLPASEEITRKGLRILDVEDRFQKLVIHSDRYKGHNSCLDKNSTKKDKLKCFNARVRVTTFVGGEKVLELLEATPALHITKNK